ncbi:hypothetical protein SUGI_1056930 [Cryptomeria japonica]|nr:hypothetical protein SUGI_1056930 [Cryptomeria japonica]
MKKKEEHEVLGLQVTSSEADFPRIGRQRCRLPLGDTLIQILPYSTSEWPPIAVITGNSGCSWTYTYLHPYLLEH